MATVLSRGTQLFGMTVASSGILDGSGYGALGSDA